MLNINFKFLILKVNFNEKKQIGSMEMFIYRRYIGHKKTVRFVYQASGAN